MTSACSTIQRTPYKMIDIQFKHQKQKSKTLDPAPTLFGDRVYVCMSGDKSKRALSHTHSGAVPGHGKAEKGPAVYL